MLLSMFAATAMLRASDLSPQPSTGSAHSRSVASPDSANPISWTDLDVARWAAQHSAAANLIESERSALLASIDRDDRAQCAQAAMTQAITRDLACHERRRAAAQALTIFHQLIGLQKQQRLLQDATPTLEQLLRFADKATELDIPDGNRFELDKQRLRVADQRAEAAGAILKLQIALSQLIDQSFEATSNVVLITLSPAPPSEPSLIEQIAIAKANRCDLKAIDSLCRSLSADTLPMARQWLGSLQPGLGVAVAIATRKPLLAALHADDRSAAELCNRREQCSQLRAERERQVEAEVHVAIVDYQTAILRQAFAKEQLDLNSEATTQVLKAIELEQTTPADGLLSKLAQLESEGQRIDRQVAVETANVKLQEESGTLVVE